MWFISLKGGTCNNTPLDSEGNTKFRPRATTVIRTVPHVHIPVVLVTTTQSHVSYERERDLVEAVEDGTGGDQVVVEVDVSKYKPFTTTTGTLRWVRVESHVPPRVHDKLNLCHQRRSLSALPRTLLRSKD